MTDLLWFLRRPMVPPAHPLMLRSARPARGRRRTGPTLLCVALGVVLWGLPACGIVLPAKGGDTGAAGNLTGTYKEFDFIGAYGALTLGHQFVRSALAAVLAQHGGLSAAVRAAAHNSTCPGKLRLDVQNASYALKFNLTALDDASCARSPFLTWPATLADLGQGQFPGPVFDASLSPKDVPDYIRNERVLYSASAKDLLKCANSSYSQLTIYSLAQQFLTVLYAQFQEFQVPQAAVQLIFGKLNNFPVLQDSKLPFKWNSVYVMETMLSIREAFKELRGIQLLSLSQTADPNQQGAECLYVKSRAHRVSPGTVMHQTASGTTSTSGTKPTNLPITIITTSGTNPASVIFPSTTSASPGSQNGTTALPPSTNSTKANQTSVKDDLDARMDKLLQAMIPVVMKSLVPDFIPSPVELKLTNSTCAGKFGDRIETIEVKNATKNEEIDYERAWTAPVAINGKLCAKAFISRLLELEPVMKSDDLGRRGLEVIEDVIPALVKKVMGEPALEAYLRMKAPSDFLEGLKEAVAKTLVSAVSIEISECPHLGDKRPIGLLIADLPTSALCGDKPQPFNCEHLKDGRTALLVRRDRDEETCMYTSADNLVRSVPKAAPTTAPMGNSTGNVTHPPKGAHIAPGQGATSSGPLGGQTAPPAPVYSSLPAAPGGVPGGVGLPMLPGLLGKLASCFPGRARVTLEDGTRVAMPALRVGDRVAVAPGVFSPVLLFTHAAADAKTEMVVIESASARLVASAGHYVHANGALVPAATVRRGDRIAVQVGASMSVQEVVRIYSQPARGLYNPQTKAGSILVHIDGFAPVLASAYTTAVPPGTAHILLAPLRWGHDWFGATLPWASAMFPDTVVDHRPANNELCVRSAVAAAMLAVPGLK